MRAGCGKGEGPITRLCQEVRLIHCADVTTGFPGWPEGARMGPCLTLAERIARGPIPVGRETTWGPEYAIVLHGEQGHVRLKRLLGICFAQMKNLTYQEVGIQEQ